MIRRFCQRGFLKPEKVEEYRALHAAHAFKQRRVQFRVVVAHVAEVLVSGQILYAFEYTVPRAADPAERAGVAVYGLVIAGMLYSALQYRGAYAAWFRLAALLFVFSDSVIAWGRFVAPIPCRTCVVMITYYAAQYLFYLFAVRAAHVRNSGSGNSFS